MIRSLFTLALGLALAMPLACNKADLTGSTDKKDEEPEPTPLPCERQPAQQFNIVLIFDNSQSQEIYDPGNIRREGAESFSKGFEKLADEKTDLAINFAIVSFNEESTIGEAGWIRLDGDNLEDIEKDIATATEKPEGRTAYSPAFRDAAKLLKEIETDVSKEHHRNYVIFLTDGLPRVMEAEQVYGGNVPEDEKEKLVETENDIYESLDFLVETYGAAVIAIASGENLKAFGEDTVRSMAKPTEGITIPGHTGVYERAQNPADLVAIWNTIFSKIVDDDCN